jgi:hypothetical protein
LRQDGRTISRVDEGAGAHRSRRKAAALFVSPDNHFNRTFSDNLRVIERFQAYQPGYHTVTTIVIAAGRLRINMAAGDDGRNG